MREIKFRAIHKLTKKMWNEEELVFHNGKWYEDWRAFEDGMSLNMSQCELMQYTGLKDANGVEIYEGDIVRCFRDGQSEVVFKKGCFGLETYRAIGNYYSTFNEVYGYCEIIGNIYENPELLERETE